MLFSIRVDDKCFFYFFGILNTFRTTIIFCELHFNNGVRNRSPNDVNHCIPSVNSRRQNNQTKLVNSFNSSTGLQCTLLPSSFSTDLSGIVQFSLFLFTFFPLSLSLNELFPSALLASCTSIPSLSHLSLSLSLSLFLSLSLSLSSLSLSISLSIYLSIYQSPSVSSP